MNYNKIDHCRFSNLLHFGCVIFIYLLTVSSTANAQVIAPGDSVYVLKEAPLKVMEKTIAAVPAGTMLKVEEVQGKWIWTTYNDGVLLNVEGWIDQSYLIKKPQNKTLRFTPSQGTLEPNRYSWQSLPKGESIQIQFESTRSNIDFFIFSEEGLAAYKWVMKNGSGQVSNYKKKLNSQKGTFNWQPSDKNQYYFLADNTNFPDGGANETHTTTITTLFWREDYAPPEPNAGLGLIIGKVSIKFDDYKGRDGLYGKPLTVYLGYGDKVGLGVKAKPEGELEVKVDPSGYFCIGNLPSDRYYWVTSVKSSEFDITIPIRFYSPINYDKISEIVMDLGSASMSSKMPTKKIGVLDIGDYDLRVNPKGEIKMVMTTPFNEISNLTKQRIIGLEGNLTTELRRHYWFKSKYSQSGWAKKVKEDLKWITNEREKRKKKKVKNPFKKAPDPPKRAPAPAPKKA